MKKLKDLIRKPYKNIQRIIGKTTVIGNFTLHVDPENSQPYILKKYPEHGTALVRLARVTAGKYHSLRIFDIGANFGDGVAMLLSDQTTYHIACIEGDGPSFGFLAANFSGNPSVALYNVFLGETDSTEHVSPTKDGGSLRLAGGAANTSKEIKTLSLDSLITQHKEWMETKLLKVDTDGYDAKILRGGASYISATQPVIYFEYDNAYLADTGEKSLGLFEFLIGKGYGTFVFFDNLGRFILSTDGKNLGLLGELDRYIKDRKGAFSYYDVAAFHANDTDIATSFVRGERERA